MTEHATESDALWAHAERIANMHLEDAEFCLVYEDEDCQDLTEDEWRRIHDLITRSRVTPPSTENAAGSAT